MTKDSIVNAPAGQPSTAAESRRSDLHQKGSIGALAKEFCEAGVEGKKPPNKNYQEQPASRFDHRGRFNSCYGNDHPVG
jgi:hypothetical protein